MANMVHGQGVHLPRTHTFGTTSFQIQVETLPHLTLEHPYTVRLVVLPASRFQSLRLSG